MRVLIVDEHPVVLLGYRQLLERDDAEVVGARDAATALAVFSNFRPAVSLIDRAVSGTSGLEILRSILDADRDARVVIMGSSSDQAFGVLALENGASGFIRKDEPALRIAEAVKTVAAGSRFVSPELVQDVAVQKSMRYGAPRLITEREAEVIRLMAHGRSMSEIAADLKVSYRTVANACNSLRCKLNARTPMELVRLAMMMGIC